MGTSFYSGSGLTNSEQDSIESSIAAAEAAQVAAEAAQAAAETAETNAETAEANSETAKVASEAAQVAAETAEANASSSASSASSDAGTATTKAAEAATSASNASSSASSASTAQTASEAAQTASETAQAASETAQAAAEAALDEFTDTYLGAKTSDPTLDNDGNALIDGALYFNTTDNVLKVYDLGNTNWIIGSSGNATQSVAGLMSAADKTKLDGVETGATADQTDAEIKTAYENNSDTNAFTDALQTKLNGIETAATADQTDAEIKTAYENNADTNAFTDALQTKLNGIETSADVTDTTNVVSALTAGDNITIAADGTVSASGGEITVQDEGSSLATAATTLNFTGNGVTASGTGAAKTINITDTNTTYSNATTSADGLMSSTDKTKLDGIEASADVTDTTNVVSALSTATAVGIGSSSPSSTLHVEETNIGASTILKVINGDEGNTDTQTAKLELSPDSRATGVQISAEKETTNFGTVAGRDISMVFKSVSNNVPDESARLNSYGHFLFGTDTTVGVASASSPSGTWIGKNGGIFAGNDGTVGFFNRQSTDGDVIEVRKDGTTVGSIGVESNNLTVDNIYNTTKSGLVFAGSNVSPRQNGANADNVVDLGASTVRWKDLYLSGGIYAGSGLGTNGQVLTSDGTNATWQDASGGSSVSMTEDAANYSLYIGSNTPTITGSNQFERNTAVGVNALNSLDVNVTNPSLNTAIGALAGEQLTTADYSTFVGAEAGQNITTTSYNTAVGARAGRGVAGTGNTYLGYFAGEYSSSAKDNQVMIGQSAGNDCWADAAVGIGVAAMSDGNHYRSVAVGYDALGRYSTSNAYYNVAIGYGALDGTYSGDGQTVVGYLADSNYSNGMAIGYGAICTGSSTTGIGYQVMATASNGSDYNTIVGYRAGYDMDGGDFNTFMGYQAGYAGGSGNTNTGIGSTALDALTSGSFNVGVGGGAGGGITTGSDNICIGTGAGTNGLTTGSNNIVIGRQIDPSSSSVSNEITLGNANISSFRCNVTTITSLSDERDKTAIEDLSYGLNFINDMRPVEFTWNRRDGTFGSKKDMGFIAQDLMDVEIEHSSATRTRLVNSENPDRLEADYMRTYPILVKAVQELSAKVDALEARIATLEGN